MNDYIEKNIQNIPPPQCLKIRQNVVWQKQIFALKKNSDTPHHTTPTNTSKLQISSLLGKTIKASTDISKLIWGEAW